MSGEDSLAEAFSDLVGELDYPMAVVTVAAGGERGGCLVGFATQCSIDPPRFAVWISRNNHTFQLARTAGVLAVHFLSAEHRELAELFGGETGDEVDKFTRCRWREGMGGVPILEDCSRWFVGSVLERIPEPAAGGVAADMDHVGFLLQPVAVESGSWPGQLGFQAVQTITPGHRA